MAGARDIPSIAERVAEWAEALTPAEIPDAVWQKAESVVLDVVGLSVAARQADYVTAVKATFPETGSCTALGHTEGLSAAGAACVNGTAAHGEDFDDTYEGTPIHVGAVAVPAVLAICQENGRSGFDLLKGIAVTGEIACRMAVVQPTGQHRAGFHPTSVIGTIAAAAGVAAALGLDATQITNAMGTAGSMASGIIEYLAEGTWTKRLHPGWAAQSAVRAAYAARAGFQGPRTVLEGEHGFYKAFGVETIEPNFTELTDDLGADWRMADLAFKPYACGTMCQPFIDAAIFLAEKGFDSSEIEHIEARVGEGTVHRLWEPRAEKIEPSTPYSAKFSGPFCVAIGFLDRAAGLSQFTEAHIADSAVRSLAARVHHVIDPDNEYPRNYTGHLRITLKNGDIEEASQPHLRGGRHEPLANAEISAKFTANMVFGGVNEKVTPSLEAICRTLFNQPDVGGVRAFMNI
jgi:2-methylcitrate dehydratase PrpD